MGYSNLSTVPSPWRPRPCDPKLPPPATRHCQPPVLDSGVRHPGQPLRSSGSLEQTAFTSSSNTTRCTGWSSRTRCGVPRLATSCSTAGRSHRLRSRPSTFERSSISALPPAVSNLAMPSKSAWARCHPSRRSCGIDTESRSRLGGVAPRTLYECTACRRRFVHKKHNGRRLKHNDERGYPCPGRSGYFVETVS